MSESTKALAVLIAAIRERQHINIKMEGHLMAGNVDKFNELGRAYTDADKHVKWAEKQLKEAHEHDGIS